MLSVKIFFLVLLVALVAERSNGQDVEQLLSCDAHDKVIIGQKTCILKCTIGCTSVGCGLFKKCEKMLTPDGRDEGQFKCHCNFGMSAFEYAN